MLTLTPQSDDAAYTACYEAPVGTVIFIDGEYEYIVGKLNAGIPGESTWQWQDILPGTELYSIYGCNHLVVTVAAA